MMIKNVLFALTFSIVLIGCAQNEDQTPQILTPEFLTEIQAQQYADSVISTLSTEEQIAQLLMVPVYSRIDTNKWSVEEKQVRDLGLGGIIVMQGGPENQRIRILKLQQHSKVPLMIASDAEWGLGMRLDSTRSFPRALTLGATRDANLVREFGEIVGQSLRLTGVHVDFAPVVDVNSNPINPVIGSRSFGEDEELVGELGLAYSEGLQSQNVLATAKHFPGHGDSDSDSHKTLPTINQTRKRLDTVELAPFKTVFDGGIGGVMIAHLEIPALDSTPGQPSTLSPYISDTLLRREMGFKGLAFTDALSMKGFADFVGDRPRARDALLAGNDILLFPGNPDEVIKEVKFAIEEGTLDSALVAEKCKRVLQAKFWTSAGEKFPTKGTVWEPEEAEDVHRKIISSSLTVLENKGKLFPITEPASNIIVLHVANKLSSGEEFSEQLRLNLGDAHNIKAFTVGKNGEALLGKDVMDHLKAADLIIVNFLETSNKPWKNYGITIEALINIERAINEISNADWAINLFANPYSIDKSWKGIIEKCTSLTVAYQDDYRTQEGMADAICGIGGAKGKLPVTPPGSGYKYGDGLGLDEIVRLGWNWKEKNNNWSATALIDSIVNEALTEDAMPGCRVLVAHKNQVIHDKCYGTTNGEYPVAENTIYDLASITKIAATSLSLMKLEEEGNFNLNDKLKAHLPELDTLELGERTFLQVLTHSAGLYPWIPFYRETLCDSIDELPVDTMYKRIYLSELKPAGEYKYSDLGFYLIYKILNEEHHHHHALDSISKHKLFQPLGLSSVGYTPNCCFDLSRIAPTEKDQIFRKCTVHGSVHDPGAHMLGGVCGHAGLFSDAHDLARLGTMLLNGGTYGDFRYCEPETIEKWTTRPFPYSENRRAIGFDKKGLNPDEGSASELASDESYGHSGFTGTLLWVDPTHDLVYVFLSNRTYPSADNGKLITMNVRTEIHRVIMEQILAEKS